MDYTGFRKAGRSGGYEINRPLTDAEKNSQLDPKEQASDAPLDWLSVIKLNSTYLELIDRWYAMKGSATWQGGIIFLLSSVGGIAFLFLVFSKTETAIILMGLLAVALFGTFFWLGFLLMRVDIFRHTHYPIRLNRRNRLVYVTRPNDSILTVPWDDLFFCARENDLPMGGTSWDVRAHVLAEDGQTVINTFTVVYPHLGDREGLMQLWEFVRCYMEEPNGVEQAYNQIELCMPVHDRREGLAFGLIRTFAPGAKWPIAQLIFSPLSVLFTVGRWVAMYTSKIPSWPADVEAACSVEAGDPYKKDWRDNGRYDFWELGWPAICFVIGLGVLCLGGYIFYTSLGV